MEISFRKANADDLDAVFQMVSRAIALMTERKIFQWDEIYPAKSDFQADIQKNELYAGTVGGKIAVVYALSHESDGQYESADWHYTGEDYLVLHRLCVSPDFQNLGVATRTLRHIESQIRGMGMKSLRLDAFLENPYALRLYSKSGYHKTGFAYWRKGSFILLEKVVDADF